MCRKSLNDLSRLIVWQHNHARFHSPISASDHRGNLPEENAASCDLAGNRNDALLGKYPREVIRADLPGTDSIESEAFEVREAGFKLGDDLFDGKDKGGAISVRI